MGVEAHVVRRGVGLPLVAVHGNGVDHRLLLALDDVLAEAGAWERIYLDLPGFGRTPPLEPPGGLPALSEWVVETVRALAAGRRFALLANSLGGLLARRVVAELDAQVLGIALIAPVVDPDPTHRTRPARTVLERDDDLLARLPAADRDEFVDVAVRQVPESWQAFAAAALPGIRAADAGAMDRLAQRYVLDASTRPAGGTFEGPALVVTGRQDHVVGHEDQLALLADYPRATYLAIDGAGHNVHLERPHLVAAALRDWSERMLLGRV